MSRGANARSVNTRLREALSTAEDDRRRLESRLKLAESERDDALTRLARIEAAEHPAIEAERMRADHAAAATAAAVAVETERWLRLIDDARPMLVRMAQITRAERVLDTRGLEAICELWGDEFATALGLNRDGRRNAMSGAEVRRTQRRFAGIDGDVPGKTRTIAAPAKAVAVRKRLAKMREAAS